MKYIIPKKYGIILMGVICFIFVFFIIQSVWALDLGALNPLQGVNPQNPKAFWPTLAGKAIQAMLGISGSFALFMIVYGGFYMLISGGDDKKFTKGKAAITWAIIGLLVIMASYALVSFVLQAMGITTSAT